jgi:hypothetical protein
MDTIQQLSQIVSQLPDTYQQDLLAYAKDMLNEVSEPASPHDEHEREQKLQELILDRYVAFRQSGVKGRPVDEVISELRTKYGL